PLPTMNPLLMCSLPFVVAGSWCGPHGQHPLVGVHRRGVQSERTMCGSRSVGGPSAARRVPQASQARLNEHLGWDIGIRPNPARSRRPCPSRRERRRRVLATLIRVPGDFDLAEEALHEDLGSVVEFAEAARWSNGRGVAPLRSVRPKGAIAAPRETAFW